MKETWLHLRQQFTLSGISKLCFVLVFGLMVGSGLASAQTAAPSGKIAFISDCGISNGGYQCLAVIDADGTNRLDLVSYLLPYEDAWSPDGTTIAFTGVVGGLFVIPAAGGTPVTLVSGASVSSPTWSPDGSRIAFSNLSNGGVIQVVPAIGGPTVSLTSSSSSRSPSWSPDGGRIAFSSDRDHRNDPAPMLELYVMNADGSGIIRLAPGVNAPLGAGWATDGLRLVFTCVSNSGFTDVCTAATDGSGSSVLTTNAYDDQSPMWAPNGSRILYASTYDYDACGNNLAHVTVMNADGSGHVDLGSGPLGTTGVTVTSPVWDPDGRRIAFTNWDLDSWVYVPPCVGNVCQTGVYEYCSSVPSVY